MPYSIAIDGPAGAGKSTIAKRVSAELGFIYVDTGAMYRAMGIYFLKNNISKDDEAAISKACPLVDVRIEYENKVQQVILNNENITGILRTEEAGKMASAIAVYSSVRSKLVEIQRKLADTCDVIMDGRDIGTVVLPDATAKIYLTASVDARAERRYNELVTKGETPDIEVIKRDIEARDYNDMHRQISPLKQTDDAVLLDSSDMNIDQVVAKIKEIFEEKRAILSKI